jgi:hypothetical protein
VLVESAIFLVVVVEQVQVAPERDGVVARVHEVPVALHADDDLLPVLVAVGGVGGDDVLVGGRRGDGSAAARHEECVVSKRKEEEAVGARSRKLFGRSLAGRTTTRRDEECESRFVACLDGRGGCG